MTVVHVCLNEVPHHEVRNPAFSTALARLWLAVDPRSASATRFTERQDLLNFLRRKVDQITASRRDYA
jgi:hypothetical protein